MRWLVSCQKKNRIGHNDSNADSQKDTDGNPDLHALDEYFLWRSNVHLAPVYLVSPPLHRGKACAAQASAGVSGTGRGSEWMRRA